MKVIETFWFSNMRGTCGIVIMEEDVTGTRKAYIGMVDGISEQTDTETILALGSKFQLGVAKDLVRLLENKDASARATLKRLPIIDDPIISEALSQLDD